MGKTPTPNRPPICNSPYNLYSLYLTATYNPYILYSMNTLDAQAARKQLRSILDEAMLGTSTVITRFGRPVATVVPYQLEHLATDPAHRPVPETLTVTNSTDGQKITFPDRVLGGATFTRADIEPMEGSSDTTTETTTYPTLAQQRAAQKMRDDLLRVKK